VLCGNPAAHRQLIAAVHDLGGLCIAAHVNTDGGAREYVRASSVRLLHLRKRIGLLRQRDNRSEEEDLKIERLEAELGQQENQSQDGFLRFLAEARFRRHRDSEAGGRSALLGYPYKSPLACGPLRVCVSSDAHCAETWGCRPHDVSQDVLRQFRGSAEGASGPRNPCAVTRRSPLCRPH